jgi:hypothetical protein
MRPLLFLFAATVALSLSSCSFLQKREAKQHQRLYDKMINKQRQQL